MYHSVWDAKSRGGWVYCAIPTSVHTALLQVQDHVQDAPSLSQVLIYNKETIIPTPSTVRLPFIGILKRQVMEYNRLHCIS